MKRTTNEMIQVAISEGYVLLTNGNGKDTHNENYDAYRKDGYDVRSWYLSLKKDNFQWVMYGKKKSSRKAKAPKKIEIDYSTLTSKELKELCKQNKVKGYGKMKKDEMINSLKEVG